MLVEPKLVEALFIFAIMWSIGCTVLEHEQDRFDRIVKKISEIPLQDGSHVRAGYLPRGLMYDYYFNPEDQSWTSWASMVQGCLCICVFDSLDFSPPKGAKFYSLLVPTADTVRNSWLMKSMLDVPKPVMFVGDSGTAKTVTIQSILKQMDVDKFNQLNVNFSSRTSSMDVQIILEENVEKRYSSTLLELT